MKFWTTPQGEELTFTEFMRKWKKGIEDVAMKTTPSQQVNAQIKSTWLMIVGLGLGIGVSIYYITKLWWALIILVGATGNTFAQLIGLKQKQRMLKSFDTLIENAEDEDKKNRN